MSGTTSILGTQRLPSTTGPHAAHHAGGRNRIRFIGHFIEMQLAMMAGMALGGPLGISAIGSTELRAGAWLIAMTVPMVAWMLVRGMGLRPSAEMALAMAVPVLAALPFFWAGPLTGRALIGIEHMSMAPAMLALMVYRRHDYGW